MGEPLVASEPSAQRLPRDLSELGMARGGPAQHCHGLGIPERRWFIAPGSRAGQAQAGIFRGRGAVQLDRGGVQGDAPRVDSLPAGRSRRSGTPASGGSVKPFDESGAFRPAADEYGFRRLAVRGAGVTMLSQSVGFAIQMIATVVLARLLTPADFGLLAMVTTFSLLLMNFGLNGFTEVVLQREDVDHRLASNLFWINVAMGIVLAVGFAAAGPLLAWLYTEPRVIAVAGAIALD